MTIRTACRNAGLLLAAAALAAAAGCSGNRRADAGAGAGAVEFPDPARATMPEGSFVNLENLRKLAPGMTKPQLYALLGTPHFNEGVFGVRRWNYVFDFRKADGSGDFIRCQFQVAFGKDHTAAAYYWKPEACKALLEPPAPAAAAPPPPAPLPAEPIRLSSDALFAFDSAALTGQGRRRLDDLLQRLRAASQVEDIRVVGYTDRIGRDAYNLVLSRRRAEAVRDYLAANGVPAASIQVEGRGEADPVVQCHDAARAALIACLAPNRRVELSGVAHARP